MIPIHSYEGRRVAVFGLGRTGLGAVRALLAGGAKVSAWDDNEAARERAVAEGLELDDLNRRDWGDIAALVLSPGVPLTHPHPHRMVELAEAVGAPVIGDMELFAREIAAIEPARRPKIVGISGTNGKSTTTALLGHILGEAGRDVRVGGNIGDSVLTLEPPRPGAVYVLELSSYQLDLCRTLDCDIGIFLNISPDHLDRHGGFAGYLAAKQRLFDMQGPEGRAVIGVDDAETAALSTGLRAARQPGRVFPISARRLLDSGVYALGRTLYEALDGQPGPVLDLDQAPALPGRHNAQNAAAAAAAASLLGVTRKTIAEAMRSFPGLAHRQERVGQDGRVLYVNDSKATNADAAAQAISSYARVYWIAGGRAKEDGLAPVYPHLDKVARAYLIGEAEAGFARVLKGKVETRRCGDLASALNAAADDAERDAADEAVVLLSPACASFDQFASFEARGDAFRDLVQARLEAPLNAEEAG
jgi:UDP-N-acetylmuramoylalanine--D-glutamate ligase